MNKFRLLLLTLMCLLLISNSATAKAVVTKEESLLKFYSGNFNSEILKREQPFSVYLPDNYHHSNKSYPVVYVLDGKFLFSTVVNTTKIRSSRDLMPESIVVGFTTSMGKNRLSLAMPMKVNKSDTNIRFANSDPKLFLKFLSDEFTPYIENQYRVANFKTIVGMSPTAGVVFTDYLEKQPHFNAHIALAAEPLVYMLDGEQIADKIAIRDTEKNNAILHISRGELDLVRDPEQQLAFKKLTDKFAKSDKVKVEVIANGEHYGMSIEGINRALLHIFPTEKVKPDYIQFRQTPGFVKQLKSFYKRVESEYGFEFYPIADGYWFGLSIAGSNRFLLSNKRSAEAVELLSWALSTQPNNVILRYNLTWALEENNQKAEAIKSAQELVAIAKKQQHKSLAILSDYLEELQGK